MNTTTRDDEQPAVTFTTMAEAEQYVSTTLGEWARVHDVPALTRELFDLRSEQDHQGQTLAATVRYHLTTEDAEEFWAMARRHSLPLAVEDLA